MRINGLISEDAVWRIRKGEPKPSIVYRLPYQRFSDHLIARHLLDKHRDKKDVASIKRSFGEPLPLEGSFDPSASGSRDMPGPAGRRP